MSQYSPLRENLITLQIHLQRTKQTPAGNDPGDLAGIISAIALGAKSIANKVKRARIEDVLGDAGWVNLHGEQQQKLDVLADRVLLHALRERPDVAVYSSEELDEPEVLRPRSDGGRFVVTVDPLDGSSNVDVAVSVGTIFSILRNESPDDLTHTSPLQPGFRQVAAGYVLYGSSVVLVVTTGQGVDMFVLDPVLGDFVLVKDGVRIPNQKQIYSVNEAYWNSFSDGLRDYLAWAHENGYGSRYVGSMCADVHRTLLKGGVFIYPPTTSSPNGKLRLLYECNPMALLMEQAGGAAAACGPDRILEVEPTELHQRCGVVLGS